MNPGFRPSALQTELREAMRAFLADPKQRMLVVTRVDRYEWTAGSAAVELHFAADGATERLLHIAPPVERRVMWRPGATTGLAYALHDLGEGTDVVFYCPSRSVCHRARQRWNDVSPRTAANEEYFPPAQIDLTCPSAAPGVTFVPRSRPIRGWDARSVLVLDDARLEDARALFPVAASTGAGKIICVLRIDGRRNRDDELRRIEEALDAPEFRTIFRRFEEVADRVVP